MKLFLFLCFLPISIVANELPPPVLPAGVGVNIHFAGGHTHDLDLIAAAGFKFVRMDFGWSGIERTKGEYDWSEYDELTRNLDQRGLRAIYILDYSNPLYEEQVDSHNALKTVVPQRDTASPQHPESIAAYSRWTVAAAQHFAGRHIIWEIWNEPNGFFWKPKPDAEQYTALAINAAEAIRKAEPAATIIGPALSGFQPAYMETFLKSGILKYLDAVSVHPYREPKKSPETAARDYQKLRELIERYAPDAQKKNLPIISGEWGYSSKAGGVSPETQAAFLVRQQLFNLFWGVPLSIWYDWKNDGEDTNEVEHNFGTVTYKLTPKPAYNAVKVMTHELAGYSIASRMPSAEQDFILVLTNKTGEKKLTVWTMADPHQTTIKLLPPPTDAVRGIDGFGETISPRLSGDELSVELDAMPNYFSIPVVSAR